MKNKRIETICSHLPKGERLADVGCDHGFCARHAFRKGLFETVYISDISEGSLTKAKKLLAKEIGEGRCVPVLADGMHGLPDDCDCLLIAGLGGEEIVRIIKEGYLPKHFVLQPMKNAEKVRAYLLERGANITADYTFGEGIYYEIIVGNTQAPPAHGYSPWELKFGRDNLLSPSPAFIGKMKEERRKLKEYLVRSGQKSRDGILERLYEIEVITNAFEEDL